MNAIYPRFALADREYYDDPARVARSFVENVFGPDPDQDWKEWLHTESGVWSQWSPPGLVLPDQGWKVHVSTTLDLAAEVLQRVSRYCRAHTLTFKHLRDRAILFAASAKDADRSSSGKFITVYPRDLTELKRTLDGLEQFVGGMPGPLVLSDLRWKNGPLSVRYGAFVSALASDDHGLERLVLVGPDGESTEDVRTPGFTPPHWVVLPPFLEEQLDAMGEIEPAPEAPRIRRALHYSNAGGVYEAEDPRTGARLVAKEGRPHAGLTADGRDAVQRLLDEEATLRALDRLPVPRIHDAFTVHGHRFLLLEHEDGEVLQSAIVPRTPLVRADAIPADYAEYRDWALGVAAQVEDAVERLHSAGYTHGDLHPGNIILKEDGSVVLLDFEMSRPLDEEPPVVIGAPGFAPIDGRRGGAADRYSVGCIKLFLFYPVTPLIDLDPAKADDILDAAAITFGLEDSWIAAVRRDLALSPRYAVTEQRRRRPPTSRARTRPAARAGVWDAGSIRALQESIGAELAAAADYSRADRLWPGDPHQFTESGIGLAHGAAGVIYAQHECGLPIDPRAISWLDHTVSHPADDRQPQRLGLWNGLAGVAWLNRRLGRHSLADEQFHTLRETDPRSLSADLYGGLPGIGLVLLDETATDPTLLDPVMRIADILRIKHDSRPLADPAAAPYVGTGTGGLMRGTTGTALFALRLHEHTGDAAHLRLAQDTINHDLARCALAADGSLQVNEGWRLLPYLFSGSAGVGLVLAQLLAYTEDERHHEQLHRIRDAACVAFAMEPGVAQGRAGLILFLAALTCLGHSTPESDAALTRHIAELRLHAVHRTHGIAFPGQGLLRLSCDLATGAAGILTALEAYSRVTQRASVEVRFPLPIPLLVHTTGSPPAQTPFGNENHGSEVIP